MVKTYKCGKCGVVIGAVKHNLFTRVKGGKLEGMSFWHNPAEGQPHVGFLMEVKRGQ